MSHGSWLTCRNEWPSPSVAKRRKRVALFSTQRRRMLIILKNNFAFLEFYGPVLSDVVYVEGRAAKLYLERSRDPERYNGIFDYLRDETLTPKDSLRALAGRED